MSVSPLLVISNPKSGDGRGPAFVTDHVLPLLAQHGVRVDKEVVTSTPGHAGTEFSDFISVHGQASRVFLILASGDGLLHEIINAAYSSAVDRPVNVSIALVPTGTANALYSSVCSASTTLKTEDITSVDYKLRSVRAMLAKQNNAVPLTITKATGRSSSGAATGTYFSIVVTSTALHASILHDSEGLREKIPDLSRFKIAAENNISRWYPGVVKFRPPEGGEVTVYNTRTGRFEQFVGDNNDPSEPSIYGPFAYFLSTVNVDRLEPSFVISPLHATSRPEVPAMDIIIIRPHRDPTINRESDCKEDHLRFAEKVGLALRAAYKDGAHVSLNYSEDGTLQEGNEHDGLRSLVENIRCTGSWRWINNGTEVAHVCVDGTIFDIEAHGEVECDIVSSSPLNFSISI